MLKEQNTYVCDMKQARDISGRHVTRAGQQKKQLTLAGFEADDPTFSLS